MDKVDWNDLLVRESIPDDYGTIQVVETPRLASEDQREVNDSILDNLN